jgi:hypothetical protein
MFPKALPESFEGFWNGGGLYEIEVLTCLKKRIVTFFIMIVYF